MSDSGGGGGSGGRFGVGETGSLVGKIHEFLMAEKNNFDRLCRLPPLVCLELWNAESVKCSLSRPNNNKWDVLSSIYFQAFAAVMGLICKTAAAAVAAPYHPSRL